MEMDDWGTHRSLERAATCPREANATADLGWQAALLDLWIDLYPRYLQYVELFAAGGGRAHLVCRRLVAPLTHDQVFMGVLQGSLLLLFLFLMYQLRLWSCGSGSDTPAPANATPDVAKQLSCDFNFVSDQEKRAAQDAATEALLEVEEKKRRKRFTKKRNCVSAGPILIALRQQSKRPKQRLFEPVSPGEVILDTYLPPREQPLTIKLPQLQVLSEPVKEEETELLEFMWVWAGQGESPLV